MAQPDSHLLRWVMKTQLLKKALSPQKERQLYSVGNYYSVQKSPPYTINKMHSTVFNLWLARQSFTLTSDDSWNPDVFISTYSHFCLFFSLDLIFEWHEKVLLCSIVLNGFVTIFFFFYIISFYLLTYLICLLYYLQWCFQSFWYVIYTPRTVVSGPLA